MDSVQADEFDPPHSGGRILLLLLDGLDEIASADERGALLEGIRVLCARVQKAEVYALQISELERRLAEQERAQARAIHIATAVLSLVLPGAPARSYRVMRVENRSPPADPPVPMHDHARRRADRTRSARQNDRRAYGEQAR